MSDRNVRRNAKIYVRKECRILFIKFINHHNICQIECQEQCQVERQRRCHVACKKLDKMLEKQQKTNKEIYGRIYVLWRAGITRSKVISSVCFPINDPTHRYQLEMMTMNCPWCGNEPGWWRKKRIFCRSSLATWHHQVGLYMTVASVYHQPVFSLYIQYIYM